MPIDPHSAEWRRIQRDLERAVGPAMEAARRLSERQFEPIRRQLEEAAAALSASPALQAAAEVAASSSFRAFEEFVQSPAYNRLVTAMPDVQDLPWQQLMEQVAEQNENRLTAIADADSDDVRADLALGLTASVGMFVFTLFVLFNRETPAAELLEDVIDTIVKVLIEAAALGLLGFVYRRSQGDD